LGDGAQIMAGAILQTGVRVGRNVIVNTRAVIDHDSCLADHVHVATGAILAGGVKVGEASHIGAGATVIQEITIGRAVLVAAGAVVVSDVADDASVAGIPARRIERSGSAA
jgi:acetyltransferase-like isoleucine patch superfamily enzyme